MSFEHDREPSALDDEQEPSLLGSTIVFTVISSVSCAMVFLVLLPWAAGRWARAIRVRDRPSGVSFGSAASAGITSAGLAVALVCHLPLLVALRAVFSVWNDEPLAALHVVGATGVSVLLVALFLRLPLVLAEGPQLGLADLVRSCARSALAAVSSPQKTAVVTAVHVGASALVVALAAPRVMAPGDHGPFLVMGACAGLALAWTGSMMLASRLTPTGKVATRRDTLVRFAAVLLLPLTALILAGVLATREPRELTVVRAASTLDRTSSVRVPIEPGVRGRLERDGLFVRGTVNGVRIEPAGGEAYEVPGAYGGDIALMSELPCGPIRRFFERSCVRIQMEGVNSTMAIELDETGRRLDDGLVDRAVDRLGTSGTIAITLGPLAFALSWLLLARVARSARRLAGGGRRHRIAGRLQLGADGWLATDGRLRGEDNRVSLLEGGATFRLPADLTPLAVAPDRRDAVDGAEVFVATDEPPGLATHRSAETPWPTSAELVIGDPASIEAEALAQAETWVVGAVLVGVVASVCALVVLSFS